jgi:hypothetical protein
MRRGPKLERWMTFKLMRPFRVLAVLCVVMPVAGLSGCGCADVGIDRVAPAERTLAVGESVTLVHETGGGCMVNNRLTEVTTRQVTSVWRTSDTAIVALDTLTGRVTGRAPGDAQVTADADVRALIHVR